MAASETEDERRTFQTLDALRGVAALAVLVLHVPEVFGGKELVPRAWMAVDFFFMLSGFVIARAYESRLRCGSMSFGDYATRRAIRLFPLIFLGALLGAVYSGVAHQRSLQNTIAALISTTLTIPLPASINDSWPKLDPPAWSLFFEIVGSLIFAAAAPRMKTRSISILTAIMAAIYIAHATSTGIQNDGSRYQYWLWGLPRVLSTFGVGAIIHRLWVNGRRLPIVPNWVLAAILVATFIAPAFERFAIIFGIYPLLVMAGANHKNIGPLMLRLETLSGELSYPLYILHWPIFLMGALILKHIHINVRLQHLSGYVFGLISIVIAFMALRIFDQPVRQWLTRCFTPALSGRKPKAQAIA